MKHETIIYAGYTGLAAVKKHIENDWEKLSKTLPERLIKKASNDCERLLNKDFTFVLGVTYKASYIHRLQDEGVYKALWKLGESLNSGFKVYLKSIPITQEIIEINEYYGLNPYLEDSTGDVLILTSEPVYLRDMFRRQGIPSEILGYITDENARVIVDGEQEKNLGTFAIKE